MRESLEFLAGQLDAPIRVACGLDGQQPLVKALCSKIEKEHERA